ncbi:ABC transporter substrate-binding protein [Cellulomonas fimi]|uniref:Extracellular solute-binding protein family 1 n=1 Tax=Cellulomonas fimi (strain ATCC 484 / DSM 20113 / JCM 1341 / CCUG 24087 / LMG 16345 / NBRC 15513 / NCIMB 8980 / NCTC 7547 / NRS-133) TaxID=590998 RepID=F4H4S7_CELFA|nr:extracellular solute-binding protein [Cellulomonas fimi]AEE44278.1 extracellular solute-binding protein family 1 [Cellulomonas fimi ATCC 484]NNH05725.1 extracellular solute-binding protein [Cellulomonas fimi]VEH26026.1 Maltose-binding periplasmic proteins/domains [Cellulomonas fimi]
MTTRRRTLTALVPATVLALAACGGGGDAQDVAAEVDFSAAPTGTMKGWAFDNADDVGEARMDHAAEQLGDVEIDLDQTAFDAQKFTTRVAGGEVPDVVQMDRRFVATYAAQDLILPLDECLAAHDVDPDERWYPFVVDDVTYEDQVWAVPQFYQPPAILLNMRVMNAAGVTPDQIDPSKPDVLLAAVAAMYRESGGVPTTLGFDPVATGQAGLWVLSQGGTLIDEEGRPTLDDPANTAALDLLKQIMDAQGGYAKVKSLTDSFDTFGDNNQFVADQVGAQVNAQWYPNVLSPYVGDVELGAVPLRGADGEPFSVASGTAFVIPAGAQNPGAACAWMLELTTLEAWEAAGEARAATREADGGINTGLFTGSPEADQVLRDAYVVPTGDAGFDQVIATYYDVLGYGQTFGASPAGQDIEGELNNAVTATLLGDKSAQEALDEAQAAAQRAYDNVTGG